MYYSFGYTHKLSPDKEIKKGQEEKRKKIQHISIDKYVQDFSDFMLNSMKKIKVLNEACDKSVLLKYEDMIYNWEVFSRDITLYLNINKKCLDYIYQKSRPKEKEDLLSHRRSGKPGGFSDKLSDESIELLNYKFKEVLEFYEYNI